MFSVLDRSTETRVSRLVGILTVAFAMDSSQASSTRIFANAVFATPVPTILFLKPKGKKIYALKRKSIQDDLQEYPL